MLLRTLVRHDRERFPAEAATEVREPGRGVRPAAVDFRCDVAAALGGDVLGCDSHGIVEGQLGDMGHGTGPRAGKPDAVRIRRSDVVFDGFNRAVLPDHEIEGPLADHADRLPAIRIVAGPFQVGLGCCRSHRKEAKIVAVGL